MFTKENENKLKEISFKFLVDNKKIINYQGVQFNVSEMFNLDVKTLMSIYAKMVGKRTSSVPIEWLKKDSTDDELEIRIEFLNLLIGFKINIIEQNKIMEEVQKIEQEIVNIQESLETPEQRIERLQAHLKELKNEQ